MLVLLILLISIVKSYEWYDCGLYAHSLDIIDLNITETGKMFLVNYSGNLKKQITGGTYYVSYSQSIVEEGDLCDKHKCPLNTGLIRGSYEFKMDGNSVNVFLKIFDQEERLFLCVGGVLNGTNHGIF